jgi:electron-transferring-flavoprotein dehydrogenase
MQKQTDVLIIGGCTAGLYFAGHMAAQGYKVLVAEKSPEQELGRRYDIIHIAAEYFETFNVPRPSQGDEDYVTSFSYNISKSALDRWSKGTHTEVLVLHRHLFIKRMAKWAIEQGAELLFDTEFQKLLYNESGRVCGATVCSGEESIDIEARLTVDCSGIPAVARTQLPDGYGVENFTTNAREQFYVVLRYVKLTVPNFDLVPTSWPFYKTWIAPQHYPGGAIIGVGANLSFDYAEHCYKRFTKAVALPEHELMYIEKSSTPYRRPPYSFVADGFVVLGDAACITNPWSGEGVPYAWRLCAIAAEEFGRVMQDGEYPLLEKVWNVNTRYINEQGAQLAQFLSMLAGAVDCSAEENDYEFEKSIIFQDDQEPQKGSLMGKVLMGMLRGRLSVGIVVRLVGAMLTGAKMIKLYRSYPREPQGFASWAVRADKLWARTIKMADLAQNDLRK